MLLVSLLLACSDGKVELGGEGADLDSAEHTGAVDTAEDTGSTDTDTAREDTQETGADDTAAETGGPEPTTIAIDLVRPAAGSTQGGDSVNLYGGPFAEDAAVMFDDAAATVSSWTTTTLTVVTPPGEEGPADVLVRTGAGEGLAAAAFAYEEPCLGVVADPSSLRMDMQTVNDAELTIAGCATGIYVSHEITNLLEFVTYPTEVDGTGTVIVRYYGSSASGGYGDWTITLGTDQGDVEVDVHVD